MTIAPRPLYIFDLDGTLALIDHRRHILDDGDHDKWRRFYAACNKDKPNTPVLTLMEATRLFSDVWIFSGRSDEVRVKTVDWLTKHTSFTSDDLDTALVMRAEGDHTADHVLKRQWYDSMLDEDRRRLCMVFDDRDRVVKMWRSLGVTCAQVAEGDF